VALTSLKHGAGQLGRQRTGGVGTTLEKVAACSLLVTALQVCVVSRSHLFHTFLCPFPSFARLSHTAALRLSQFCDTAAVGLRGRARMSGR
jgi:hypothetical protein